MTETAQPLSSLASGGKATVQDLQLTEESRARLMELGLLVGTPIEVIRFAPLGDPLEIKVRGYHLTLRRHEADQILVSQQP
jgi:ferrous iron transport protein A